MTDTAATRQVVISGTTFWLDRIQPEPGLKIFGNLQAKFFPTLANGLDVLTILKSPGTTEDKIATATAMALPAFGQLSSSLTGDELVALCKSMFVEETITFQKEGSSPQKLTPLMWNTAFAGPFDMIELAVEVIDWNFSPFLTRFATLFGNLAARYREATAKKLS